MSRKLALSRLSITFLEQRSCSRSAGHQFTDCKSGSAGLCWEAAIWQATQDMGTSPQWRYMTSDRRGQTCRSSNCHLRANIFTVYRNTVGLSHWPRGLRRRSRLLGYWDRRFESSSRNGCLTLCFCVVLSWPLVQRSPTECLNQITKPPVWGGQGPYEDCRATDEDDEYNLHIIFIIVRINGTCFRPM
jgi:hypothetical protein